MKEEPLRNEAGMCVKEERKKFVFEVLLMGLTLDDSGLHPIVDGDLYVGIWNPGNPRCFEVVVPCS